MNLNHAIMPARDDCSDPLGLIEHYHQRIVELCAALETIADTLPRPSLGCRDVASELATLLPLHHADEERGLFAILRRKCIGGKHGEIAQVLNRLCADHTEDDAALMDIVEYIDMLGHAGNHRRAVPMEAVGYAIRGFFQAKRRHLSLETAIIMPFARTSLLPAERVGLERIMQDNRNRQCAKAGAGPRGMENTSLKIGSSPAAPPYPGAASPINRA